MSGRHPRKILLSIRHAVGGIRTYLKYTLGRLDPDRYRLMVVTIGGVETPALKEDLKAFRPQIIEVPSEHAVPRLALGVHAACLTWRPDILHSHGFTAGVASVPGALISGTPHLLTSHDVFLPEHFVGLKGAAKRSVLTWFLNRPKILHAVGTGAAENIREYLPGFDASRMRIVRNAVPPPPPPNEVEGTAWRQEVGKSGEKLFGFFGRFVPQKGFEYLIDAVVRLKAEGKTGFRILAISDGSLIREYRAIIERKGVSDRFSFLGFVPNARRLMPWLDGVIMPSLWEACPLQTMEALSAGVPYISTDIPGVRELVEGSPAIIVAPRDAVALSDAISRVMADPQAHKDRAKAFAPEAERRFSIAESAAGLERLYEEVLTR